MGSFVEKELCENIHVALGAIVVSAHAVLASDSSDSVKNHYAGTGIDEFVNTLSSQDVWLSYTYLLRLPFWSRTAFQEMPEYLANAEHIRALRINSGKPVSNRGEFLRLCALEQVRYEFAMHAVREEYWDVPSQENLQRLQARAKVLLPSEPTRSFVLLRAYRSLADCALDNAVRVKARLAEAEMWFNECSKSRQVDKERKVALEYLSPVLHT